MQLLVWSSLVPRDTPWRLRVIVPSVLFIMASGWRRCHDEYTLLDRAETEMWHENRDEDPESWDEDLELGREDLHGQDYSQLRKHKITPHTNTQEKNTRGGKASLLRVTQE
jgi:hypothetical protein